MDTWPLKKKIVQGKRPFKGENTAYLPDVTGSVLQMEDKLAGNGAEAEPEVAAHLAQVGEAGGAHQRLRLMSRGHERVEEQVFVGRREVAQLPRGSHQGFAHLGTKKKVKALSHQIFWCPFSGELEWVRTGIFSVAPLILQI